MAQAVAFALFFQLDQGKIKVIAAETEFLPLVHAIDFFPQSLVAGSVKIQASDLIAPGGSMGIRSGHSLETPAQDGKVCHGNFVLPFVAVVW